MRRARQHCAAATHLFGMGACSGGLLCNRMPQVRLAGLVSKPSCIAAWAVGAHALHDAACAALAPSCRGHSVRRRRAVRRRPLPRLFLHSQFLQPDAQLCPQGKGAASPGWPWGVSLARLRGLVCIPGAHVVHDASTFSPHPARRGLHQSGTPDRLRAPGLHPWCLETLPTPCFRRPANTLPPPPCHTSRSPHSPAAAATWQLASTPLLRNPRCRLYAAFSPSCYGFCTWW